MAAKIAMTHATGLGPLPALLEERGGSRAVARAFAAESLPLALVEERSHRVPLRAIARLAGDSRIGLDAGLAMVPDEYGRWVRFAMQAPTLGDAVIRLSRGLVLHQVGGALGLQARPDGTVVWGYRQSAVGGPAAMQHDDHILPVMVRVARAYCGADWAPVRIESRASDPGDAAAREDATAAQWRFGAATTGIVLRAAALWARREPSVPASGPTWISSREILAEIRLSLEEGESERLAAIVALRLLDGRTDMDGAARMAGLRRRTLQRRLDADGLTYRDLLDRVRMDRARALIRETDAPLSEIAHLVGYSDPAHFTRAFRRRFGSPPSAERDAAPRQAPAPEATEGRDAAPADAHA